jgi:YfiH family protein
MEIIRSALLGKYPEIVFGISTKEGGVSPPPFYMNLSFAVPDSEENVLKNREIFFNALGVNIDSVNFQKQVHCDDVKYIEQGGHIGDCDATVTDKKNVFLTVSVADCLPVFLYEPEKKVIAAVHAGWRGTERKIVQKAVKELEAKFSAEAAKMTAYIGPGICFKCFEVGDEVAEKFRDEVKEKRGEKYYINLSQENKIQLVEAGLKESSIEICSLCTMEEKDLLHSYRRDGINSGRMYGVIGVISS